MYGVPFIRHTRDDQIIYVEFSSEYFIPLLECNKQDANRPIRERERWNIHRTMRCAQRRGAGKMRD